MQSRAEDGPACGRALSQVTTGQSDRFASAAPVCYNPSRHPRTPLIEIQNPPAGFSFLARNFAAQDDRFRNAFSIVGNAIAARTFPACSLAVTFRGELVAYKTIGRFAYDPASAEVTTASLFDLASLTKVVATTAMAMILYERGLLDLEAPITAIVPEFASEFADRFADDPRRREVTLRMLLAHTSGLPAYEKLFLRAHSREELLQ